MTNDFSPLTRRGLRCTALTTDQRSDSGSLIFPLLGLFGETGSLLSEVKKKQRDRASYIGYTGGHGRANRRQCLCRAIFQYRDAVDVVGDNRRHWSSTSSGYFRAWKRRWIFEFGSGSSKAERGALIMPGKRQT